MPVQRRNSGAVCDRRFLDQCQIVHADVFGVIQPGADFQVLYRMFQAYRHADASRRIGHHPLLGQHPLALG
ncbi:hypothetical protein XGA_1653 [Xanthomonas hortorum ATCC 19865]|nr:hypothetical protein XGA_1653 [Xanthomonas hortorum ATCC 19865]